MKKLTRDARAFGPRALMGNFKFWLIVEGRSHDRSFYDEVLQTHPYLSSAGYEIRLAEDFSINGESAGGKAFAKKLFDLWESRGELDQMDEYGRRSMVAMALDKDFDQISGRAINSRHVLYTSGMDVESEILRNTDLPRAIRSTYSLPISTAAAIIQDARTAFDRLVALYWEWIILGAIADCCYYRGPTRFARLATYRLDGFGKVDRLAQANLVRSVLDIACRNGRDEWLEQAEEGVLGILDGGDGWRLIKGRWLAFYIEHLVSNHAGDVVESKVPASTLAKTALAYIDPNSDTFSHYHKRLDALLQS